MIGLPAECLSVVQPIMFGLFVTRRARALTLTCAFSETKHLAAGGTGFHEMFYRSVGRSVCWTNLLDVFHEVLLVAWKQSDSRD
jgi:hypothetical protein